MAKALITGSWKKLIFINYEVDPKLLRSYVPRGTRLNIYNDKCYLTLAGFDFSGIRIAGIPMIFHRHVPEINLRFYVVPKKEKRMDLQAERGVVFIKEIISRPLMAMAANVFYKEHYSIWPVGKTWEPDRIAYHWHQPIEQLISVRCAAKGYYPREGSHEEFIMMQYYGYTCATKRKTLRYKVEHPLWKVYPVEQVEVDVDFKRCFGKRFKFLNKQNPASIFLAEGSAIGIHTPKRL